MRHTTRTHIHIHRYQSYYGGWLRKFFKMRLKCENNAIYLTVSNSTHFISFPHISSIMMIISLPPPPPTRQFFHAGAGSLQYQVRPGVFFTNRKQGLAGGWATYDLKAATHIRWLWPTFSCHNNRLGLEREREHQEYLVLLTFLNSHTFRWCIRFLIFRLDPVWPDKLS